MSALSSLKSTYWLLTGDRSEEKTILRFMKHAGADADWKILDVGCGYGRNLKRMREFGLNPTGVDTNPDIIRTILTQGFACHDPEDPAVTAMNWDIILMSHFIEHFDFRPLFGILNKYLDVLKPSGYLIIASPLPSVVFWDNFDHVKPYTPAAVEEVFGFRGRQVQFQSDHEIVLRKLWIRRRAFTAGYREGLYRREMSPAKAFWGAINVLANLIHLLSFHGFGRADGWVGMYQKMS